MFLEQLAAMRGGARGIALSTLARIFGNQLSGRSRLCQSTHSSVAGRQRSDEPNL